LPQEPHNPRQAILKCGVEDQSGFFATPTSAGRNSRSLSM
jgi:hypothetical protein